MQMDHVQLNAGQLVQSSSAWMAFSAVGEVAVFLGNC